MPYSLSAVCCHNFRPISIQVFMESMKIGGGGGGGYRRLLFFAV